MLLSLTYGVVCSLIQTEAFLTNWILTITQKKTQKNKKQQQIHDAVKGGIKICSFQHFITAAAFPGSYAKASTFFES